MANKGTDDAFFEKLLANSESIDFRKLLVVFLSRWYWVAAALVISLLTCLLYLKFTQPQFVASITLKYLEKQSQLEEFNASKPTYIFNSGNTDYLTEKFTVKSQEVVENTLKKLNNPFSFYRIKDVRRIDAYPFRAFDAEIIQFDNPNYQDGVFFLSENYELTYLVDEASQPFKFAAGTVVTVPGLTFRINSINTNKGYAYEFVFNPIHKLAGKLISKIEMLEVEEAMPILNLSFKHHNKAFTKNFLEKLVEAYQEFDLSQKQKSSDLTLRFISDQLQLYSDSLKVAGRNLELFKQKNQVLDIGSSTSEIVRKLNDLQQQKQELEIQKAYISILEKNLGTTFEPINYLSVGLDATSDNILVSLIQEFNTTIGKRKELILKYSANSPAVKNLDEGLNKTRVQILENISLQKQKIKGLDHILTESVGGFKKRFNQIPGLEKNYLYLQSSFEVNKNTYSLLLNKEIESSIVRAGMLPSFATITRLDIDQVSPKSLQLILLSVFLGLALGVGAILLARVGNSKFSEIRNVDGHKNVQLLGVVNHFPEKLSNNFNDLPAFISNRSIFGESISSLRTKLSFSKGNLAEQDSSIGKQILITSEKSGEGKSFVTINLALSLTKIGKKVIIIGADLRKSQLHRYFKGAKNIGLSEYLQGNETEKTRIINHSELPNLDFVIAGTPPFNPAELLQLPQFEELMDHFRKHYDYLLVDTAPIGLVSDNIPLLQSSDHVLFIIRWLYSSKECNHLAGQLAEDYGVKEVKIIINDFYPEPLHSPLTTKKGYTGSYNLYNYASGYTDNGYFSGKPKGWFRKIFRY